MTSWNPALAVQSAETDDADQIEFVVEAAAGIALGQSTNAMRGSTIGF